MAYIEKRGNAYKIRVSCGYDTSGKQVRQSITWKPEPKMTEKQIKKELQKRAVLFEQQCLKGQVTAAIKLEDFARQWFKEYAEIKLKKNTLSNYYGLTNRIYKKLGYMRMDKITPRHIQQFILDMTAENGNHYKSRNGKLSAKTIKLHVSLISTIFSYAIKMQVLSVNPCRAVTLPKPDAKEREIYTVEETQQILDLLLKEDKKDFHYVVYCILAFFSGFRRGELLGIEHKDIDFNKQILSVNRTSNYNKKDGLFTDTPKTRTSYRTLKMSAEVIDLLKRYKVHQAEYAQSIGDKWIDTDRLFTTWDGTPMFPTNPGKWFKKFCKQHGIRYLNLHSCRHFAASMLINAGLDVKSVQQFMGHSTAQTTLSVYCHAFDTARVAAMEAITGTIQLKM